MAFDMVAKGVEIVANIKAAIKEFSFVKVGKVVKVQNQTTNNYFNIIFLDEKSVDAGIKRIQELLHGQAVATDPNIQYKGVDSLAVTSGTINNLILKNSEYILTGKTHPQYVVGTYPLILTDGAKGVISITGPMME